MASAWATAPIVFVSIPTCDHCGSREYTRVRTESAGDGSYSHKCICDACSGRFLIVFELPETGSEDDCG